MKRIIYSAALLLAMMATACGSGNKEVAGLPQIDVNASYPEKEICLQDVAEVSYIVLDSQEDFLFRGKLEEVSSKGIAVIGNDKIYLFHPDGKARNIIDKKGQGPGERRSLRTYPVSKSDVCLFIGWRIQASVCIE